MPKWTATTVLRETLKTIEAEGIDPGQPIQGLIDKLRDRIVETQLGGQLTITNPEDAGKPPAPRKPRKGDGPADA